MGQVTAKRTQNYTAHGEHVFNNCSLHYCNRSRTNHYSEHSDYLSAQTALRCARCPKDSQATHPKTRRSHILSRHPLHHLFFHRPAYFTRISSRSAIHRDHGDRTALSYRRAYLIIRRRYCR